MKAFEFFWISPQASKIAYISSVSVFALTAFTFIGAFNNLTRALFFE